MNIEFNVNLKELDSLDEDQVLMIFDEFIGFMAMYEERMTFAEADKYWAKHDKLEKYIQDKFGIDNPFQEIRKRFHTLKRRPLDMM